MKKIAFLFLVLDNPHFPEIWDKYFKENEDKYTIYIHPKYPNKTTWRKESVIDTLVETSWGFITRAYIELLKAAYKDPDNWKFVTISESCIPVTSFEKFYEDVISDPRSWIKSMKVTKYNIMERINKQKDALKKNKSIYIPNTIKKNYARFCLNRNHVSYLLKNEKKLEFFHRMHVGDEFFLSILENKNTRDFAVTYDDWEYTEKLKKKIKNKKKVYYEKLESYHVNIKKKIDLLNDKNKIKKLENMSVEYSNHIHQKLKLLDDEFNKIAGNPKTITRVSKDDYRKIKTTDSYFYRKFSKDSDIEKYKFHKV